MVIQVATEMSGKKNSMVWHNPHRATIGGLWILGYFSYLVYFRYSLREMIGLYEMLWACNSALVVACFGMLTFNKTAIACAVSMISLAHMLWYLCAILSLIFFRIVDVLCWFTIGKFPLGSAKYIVDPGTKTSEIIMTLHHLWFVPLCMWVLYKNGPLGVKGLVTSVFASIALGSFSRYATPLWAPLPDGNLKYVNINMSHEMWKDVPMACPHYYDNSHPIIYLAYALAILNIGNLACYLVWKLFYYIFFWSDEVHGSPKTKKA